MSTQLLLAVAFALTGVVVLTMKSMAMRLFLVFAFVLTGLVALIVKSMSIP